MTDAALRLSGVACARGGRVLLRGIDLTLGPGACLILRGPNGTGKSSLMRLAAGLLPPFAGTVERIGAVALSDENPALDMNRPLGKALGFWATLDRATPMRLTDAMRAMGVSHLSDVPARMLSTGQRKRATLARVIASGAPIWLLDEPANGLDDSSRDMLGAAVAHHLERGGILLAASHQPLPVAGALELDLSRHVAGDAA